MTLALLMNLGCAGGGAVAAPAGPHARTGESGWSGGTWSDPASGGGWSGWGRR